MAVPTINECIDRIREFILDTDTTDQAYTDARIKARFHEKYLRWMEGSLSQRTSWLNHISLTGGITALTAGAYSLTTSPSDIISFEQVYRESASNSSAGSPLERIEVNDMMRLLKEEPTQGTPTKYALMRDSSSSSTNIGKWRLYFHPISDGNASAGWFISAIVRKYPATLDTTTSYAKTGDYANGANSITNMSNTTSIVAGMVVTSSASGIPDDTLVLAVNSTTVVTLSKTTTAAATGATLTFTRNDTPDVSESASYTLCRLVAAELAGELGRDPAFVERILAPVTDDVMQSMGVTRRGYMLPRPRPDEGAA